MNEKAKIILSETGEESVEIALEIIDDLVFTIPGLSIAWKLARGIYGSGLKLRQKRALEFIELIRDNPNVFTAQLLETESFQDGFVYALEKFIIERNEKKRRIAKNVFLGFVTQENQNAFELEKFTFILNQLSESDLYVFSIFADGAFDEWRSQNTQYTRRDGLFNAGDVEKALKEIRKNEDFDNETIFECCMIFQSAGLVTALKGGGFGMFRLSKLGIKFIQYIL